jgi:hypothetical protein
LVSASTKLKQLFRVEGRAISTPHPGIVERVDNRGEFSGELALIPESFSDSGYNSPKLKDVFYLLVMNLPMQRIYVFSNSRNKRCLLPFVRICIENTDAAF